MPSKRTRRSRHLKPTELPGSMVDLLLTGDYMSAHDSRALGIDDTYVGWAPLIDYHERDLPRLWREHRDELMAKWRERGLPGEPWGAQFDRERN